MKTIAIIVATDLERGIGKDNQLLWHLPADLKFFKQTTSGNTIIMGRKTFDSIGKALPNRRNIVISRNKNLKIENIEIVHSLSEAVELCANDANEIFIIGGAEIYNQSLPFSNLIYLTKVEGKFNADAFFPELNMAEWETTNIEKHQADERNKYDYSFITLKKKINNN